MRYLAAVSRVLRSLGRREMSPAGLFDQWSQFVAECEAGYGWSVYEYENELSVRRAIQAALEHPDVSKYPQAQEWAVEVAMVDSRFQDLLTPIPSAPKGAPWWSSGVPRYGRPEFAADVRRIYGVAIRGCD